ncbi:hypothetical protein GGR42_000551 [Saonia flava]|uniref:DUF4249 domain-containing protein n=1 Tax=Saonia flava TaxID=523696 RepID=A0A846QZQ9_9FLAO|nr:DUF4249 domain-containing protein [Saonia flava]NJB70089.1 hypothetical protein [Saonia flava]
MKEKRRYIQTCLIALLGVILCNCIEEIEPESVQVQTQDFENVLVVEASITNEIKQQQVLLSRASSFENDTVPPFERNAEVSIVDSEATTYSFFESEPGTYVSSNPFSAEEGKTYRLEINTVNGESYTSDEMSIVGTSEITNLYAERITNDLGVEGMSIFIDNDDSTSASKYYKYEYEETYKIIAENWNQYDFKLTNYDPCALPTITYDLEIVPREVQNRVCYNTVASNSIIQASSENLVSDKLIRFPIRFIGRDDYILTHRYSILVKQYVQSAEAYSYYDRLGKFSESGNIFSQIQPGLLNSNVHQIGNSEATTLGYFEVTSVTEKRLFFNYEDFFAGEDLPTNPYNCDSFHSAPLEHVSYCYSGPSDPNPCPLSIIESIHAGIINYDGENGSNIGTCPGPYLITPSECGDCTTLGSNIEPEFWVD